MLTNIEHNYMFVHNNCNLFEHMRHSVKTLGASHEDSQWDGHNTPRSRET